MCLCLSDQVSIDAHHIILSRTYSQLTDQIPKSPASEVAGESKVIFTRVKCTKQRTTEKRFSISCVYSAVPFWLLSGAYIIVVIIVIIEI